MTSKPVDPGKSPPWRRKSPPGRSQPLSAVQKEAARARAEQAGRRYPNLVDNMWAVQQVPRGDVLVVTSPMRTFVLRARAAPTESRTLLASVGGEAHTEILAHTLMNAIFVAQSHRADVTVYLVLESTRDYSRTIRFDANAMEDIGGFHEQALLGKIARALDASVGMGKEELRPVEAGIAVRTISFERLVQELAEDNQLFVMDRKGAPIREQAFEGNPCFLLTDHIPMPKKTLSGLERLGVRKIALGSKMLFASQCVVLIHHELDQR